MSDKQKSFVSAVIYVHNTEKEIETFLKTVINTLENNFENSEIICVNDNSMDDSVQIIKKVSSVASTASVSILNMSYYHGIEGAMNAGMDLAIGDFVFEFDSVVNEFGEDEIMSVYQKALTGYDIVSASPDRKQKLSSKLFYYVFDKFTSLKYEMYTETFRVLSRRVINRIGSMNKTIPYRKAIYANCGLKTTNMKYHVENSSSNNRKDKQERRYKRGLAVDTLILFTELGYSFAMTMTFIMIAVAVLTGIYSVIVFLVGNPVAGWTTTILFLAFSFFGLFGILTVIIKYLQITVNLVFKRKRYSFEGIEKLTK